MFKGTQYLSMIFVFSKRVDDIQLVIAALQKCMMKVKIKLENTEHYTFT